MGKLLNFFFIFSIIILLIVFIFKSQFFRFSPGPEISETYQDELFQLAQEASAAKDLPVSAIVVYGDKVIGTGFNTVLRDNNAAGHAVINAISSAIAGIGYYNFMNMDRDSLKIISTIEPCAMCRQAIELYNIKNVQFLKARPYYYSLGNLADELWYEYNKTQRKPSSLQDSLFNMYPYSKEDN